MDKIVKILLEREVLDGDEFAKLMDGDSDSKPEDASAKPAEPAKVNSASTEPGELKDNLPDLPNLRIDKLPDDKLMA